MQDQRPDSDSRPTGMQEAEAQPARGKLKIFLGATAGVGKTYAVLVAAQERCGVDVVVGWVETHGRAETAALLQGLRALSRRSVAYTDALLDAFDLDTALSRHPELILVDELAHTNAPGLSTPNAGRMWRRCSTPGSTSIPRSTCNTWRASMT